MRNREFQQKHGVGPHAASPAKDTFDGRVEGLDDSEADVMIAVRGDAIEMIHQRAGRNSVSALLVSLKRHRRVQSATGWKLMRLFS